VAQDHRLSSLGQHLGRRHPGHSLCQHHSHNPSLYLSLNLSLGLHRRFRRLLLGTAFQAAIRPLHWHVQPWPRIVNSTASAGALQVGLAHQRRRLHLQALASPAIQSSIIQLHAKLWKLLASSTASASELPP